MQMIDIFKILGLVLVATWVLWALYVFWMGIYRAYLDKRLVGINKVLAFPIWAIAIGVDVGFNIFLATILFLDLPREFLLTDRLKRYRKGFGWRSRVAEWICDRVLDVFDPRGDHC
jgi:hypothetical protein